MLNPVPRLKVQRFPITSGPNLYPTSILPVWAPDAAGRAGSQTDAECHPPISGPGLRTTLLRNPESRQTRVRTGRAASPTQYHRYSIVPTTRACQRTSGDRKCAGPVESRSRIRIPAEDCREAPPRRPNRHGMPAGHGFAAALTFKHHPARVHSGTGEECVRRDVNAQKHRTRSSPCPGSGHQPDSIPIVSECAGREAYAADSVRTEIDVLPAEPVQVLETQ